MRWVGRDDLGGSLVLWADSLSPEEAFSPVSIFVQLPSFVPPWQLPGVPGFPEGKKKICIIIWKSCHTKALIVNFPHKMPRERTANVCLWTGRVDFWWNGSSEHCIGCTC